MVAEEENCHALLWFLRRRAMESIPREATERYPSDIEESQRAAQIRLVGLVHLQEEGLVRQLEV